MGPCLQAGGAASKLNGCYICWFSFQVKVGPTCTDRSSMLFVCVPAAPRWKATSTSSSIRIATSAPRRSCCTLSWINSSAPQGSEAVWSPRIGWHGCTFDLLLVLVRPGPALSGEHEKVFHRSLDLLLIWVTDCRAVDFTPQPELVCTLENFLNTEVSTLLRVWLG